MATAGGQVYLLLATASSLGVIAITVALTSSSTSGRRCAWERDGNGDGGLNEKHKTGGLLKVLR